MDSSQKKRIRTLLTTLSQKNGQWKRDDPEYAPDLTINPGASAEQINELRQKLNGSAPPDLLEWLTMCNGFGGKSIEDTKGHNEIIELCDIYPNYWQQLGCIPIAGDGCGNYYWVRPIEKNGKVYCPVVFIDQIDMVFPKEGQPSEEPTYTYIAASSIPKFFEFFLEQCLFDLEMLLDEGYAKTDDSPPDFWWPFEDEEKVLERDPDIESFDFTLPWDCD